MQEFRHPGGGILFQLGSLALREVAQHSVQPTSGILRVFLAVFSASAGFRFHALSTSRPLAANAGRWVLDIPRLRFRLMNHS